MRRKISSPKSTALQTLKISPYWSKFIQEVPLLSYGLRRNISAINGTINTPSLKSPIFLELWLSDVTSYSTRNISRDRQPLSTSSSWFIKFLKFVVLEITTVVLLCGAMYGILAFLFCLAVCCFLHAQFPNIYSLIYLLPYYISSP